MPTTEIQFDGLIGPTHNYAGLAIGNLHSMASARSTASPRQAVKQGIAKMRRVMSLGVTQAVLPPHHRPDMALLRGMGFSGSESNVLQTALREAPAVLAAACSASGMWAANAATVAPSADTADGRLHLTPANLSSLLHRSIEAKHVARVFAAVFADESRFAVHDALGPASALADEGAANHTRFCATHDAPGVHLFAFGRDGIERASPSDVHPVRFRGRQTREASESIARLHELNPNAVIFARQSQKAIDAGVFHNDVISVGNQHVFLYHEESFEDTGALIATVAERLRAHGGELAPVRVSDDELSLDEASSSYIFNSQLLTTGDGSIVLVAPTDTHDNARAKAVVDRIIADDNPIARVEYVDVRQSMRNGGGPACLRLRVVMTAQEQAAMHEGVLMTPSRLDILDAWADRHYREQLRVEELADPALLRESEAALDQLTSLLGLGTIYPFQT